MEEPSSEVSLWLGEGSLGETLGAGSSLRGFVYLQETSGAVEEGAVLTALSSAYDRQVLAHAQSGPVSAKRLLDETSIPKSTLYRRINTLEERGLLQVVGGAVRDGRPVDRYVCPLKEIRLNIQDGCLELDWDVRDA